jgi:hypothetical protein
VSDAAFKQYATLFKGPPVPKAIAAVRAATCLADDDVSKATAALAMDEMAAKVEVATT